MSVVFPNSNLPTSSQPWAREVQKQLSNVIAADSGDRINNAARDNQLNSSIIALTGVVNDVSAVQTTISNALIEIGLIEGQVSDLEGNVYFPGTEEINGANIRVGTLSASQITTGTLNANNVTITNLNASSITAGTLTGINIQSAAFGTRVVMSSSQLEFYFGSSYVGKIEGNDNSWSSGAALTLVSSTGGAQISLDGSSVSLFATSSGQGITVDNSGNTSYGNFRSTNQLSADGRVYFPGLGGATSDTPNMRWATGFPLGELLVIGGSTRDIKTQIQPIDDVQATDSKKLLEIPVRAFKYIDGYLSAGDTRVDEFIPGFIVEEMDEVYPIAVDKASGKAENWNPRYIIPGMLALIQELYTRIETLEKGA